MNKLLMSLIVLVGVDVHAYGGSNVFCDFVVVRSGDVRRDATVIDPTRHEAFESDYVPMGTRFLPIEGALPESFLQQCLAIDFSSTLERFCLNRPRMGFKFQYSLRARRSSQNFETIFAPIERGHCRHIVR